MFSLCFFSPFFFHKELIQGADRTSCHLLIHSSKYLHWPWLGQAEAKTKNSIQPLSCLAGYQLTCTNLQGVCAGRKLEAGATAVYSDTPRWGASESRYSPLCKHPLSLHYFNDLLKAGSHEPLNCWFQEEVRAQWMYNSRTLVMRADWAGLFGMVGVKHDSFMYGFSEICRVAWFCFSSPTEAACVVNIQVQTL